MDTFTTPMMATFTQRLRPPLAAATPLRQRRRLSVYALKEDDPTLRLRSEAEAPFRLFRLSLYGSAVAGGGIGLLVNLTQIIGTVVGKPGAPTLLEALKNVGIDLTALALFGYLAWNEWGARNRQMQRLSRESRLGNLAFQTTTEKLLKISDLRGVSRVVVVAGTESQLETSLDEAEEFREKLTQAGVYIIQAPIYGEPVNTTEEASEEDKRFKGRAVRLDEWREWFADQMEGSSVTSDAGLYVGLRLDGRVRASGKGLPPWFRIANELPPMEGIWQGFGDGFDGPV